MVVRTEWRGGGSCDACPWRSAASHQCTSLYVPASQTNGYLVKNIRYGQQVHHEAGCTHYLRHVKFAKLGNVS